MLLIISEVAAAVQELTNVTKHVFHLTYYIYKARLYVSENYYLFIRKPFVYMHKFSYCSNNHVSILLLACPDSQNLIISL